MKKSVLASVRLLLALSVLLAAGPGSRVVASQNGAVTTVTAEQIHQLVAQHSGKVVAVNFWATWCPPCRTEFPDIVKVYREYHESGLDVIAVSMNAADETQDVEQFLKKYQPPFPVYRAASQDETFYDRVTSEWSGELPVTLIFDRSGRQVRFHKKALNHDELAMDVAALLRAPAR